jgi:hypothetical protein
VSDLPSDSVNAIEILEPTSITLAPNGDGNATKNTIAKWTEIRDERTTQIEGGAYADVDRRQAGSHKATRLGPPPSSFN